MKSFFSSLSGALPKAGGNSSTTPPKRSPQQADKQAGNEEVLTKAEELLKRLRKATMQDFPLLNEATRLGDLDATLEQRLVVLELFTPLLLHTVHCACAYVFQSL